MPCAATMPCHMPRLALSARVHSSRAMPCACPALPCRAEPCHVHGMRMTCFAAMPATSHVSLSGVSIPPQSVMERVAAGQHPEPRVAQLVRQRVHAGGCELKGVPHGVQL